MHECSRDLPVRQRESTGLARVHTSPTYRRFGQTRDGLGRPTGSSVFRTRVLLKQAVPRWIDCLWMIARVIGGQPVRWDGTWEEGGWEQALYVTVTFRMKIACHFAVIPSPLTLEISGQKDEVHGTRALK